MPVCSYQELDPLLEAREHHDERSGFIAETLKGA
jgi:hypothetical protein